MKNEIIKIEWSLLAPSNLTPNEDYEIVFDEENPDGIWKITIYSNDIY
tara:strand:+ start:67 stop:210 length:144 start_codon:yes stop_codon:yes gene_type:complete